VAHGRLRRTAFTRKGSEGPTRARKRKVPPPAVADDVGVAPRQLLSLFTATDLDALIKTVFTVVGAAVECDFVSALYRNAGNGLLKERDSLGREYHDPAFMLRYAELTPALPLVMSNPGMKILSTRTGLPGTTAEIRRTAFYREIMRPQGWRHALTLCFWGDRPAELPILVTAAYRREGRRDFSEGDVTTFERIHPFIDCAVNRIYDREAAETLQDGFLMTAKSAALGCAILDRNLLPIQVDGAAHQLSAAWVDDEASTHTEDPSLVDWRMPPALAAECRELHHEWHVLGRANPDATGLRRRRRVVHPRIPGLAATITMICPTTTGLAEPTFVLELDRHLHGVSLDTPDRTIPVLRKLTKAERAVAMVLADGCSNQEIADRLGKSVHAVKFLLHRIYKKTGVPNRAALVAVLRSRPRRSKHAS